MEKKFETFEAALSALRENGDTFGSVILLEDAATGDKIPQSHLSKIKKWTRTTQDPESIHTYPVLMIDTAPTRNSVIYTEASQKKSVRKWAGTPQLFNHKGTSSMSLFGGGGADHTLQAASQMGRIYDARIVTTPKGETGTLGWFYTVEGVDDATNAFIKKIDTGILREVSIHVAVPDGVICSICKDSFSKCKDNSDEYHYPGEKYGKETCYMSTGEGLLVPLELSSVACPGSVNAHIMQDDEVENYPVLSMREALGGSREVITDIQEAIVLTKEQEQAEALKTVQRIAKEAGVSVADATKVLLAEAKKECSECGHASHEGKECTKEGCECDRSKGEAKKNADDKNEDEGDEKKQSDPPEDDDKKSKKAKKQDAKPKHALFEGVDCPVCGRAESSGGSGDESATIAEMRVAFQDQVANVVAEAKKKVEQAAVRAEQFDEIFDMYVQETAKLAVDAGLKKSSEIPAYMESLKKLSFAAVKEIREALTVRAKPTAEAKTEKLKQTMVERAKQNNGATEIVEAKDGTKSARSERALFAAK